MEDIVCNRCSLLCDDVLAEIDDNKAKAIGLCRLGYTHLERVSCLSGIEAIFREDGKEHLLNLEKALAMAADMLMSAKHPLLYGWSRCTNETIKEGLSLAQTLKAVFDSSASMGLAQAVSVDAHHMNLKTDLDVVHDNGEFILYWGSNPIESNHRHASRFTVFPRGESVPQGVESRVIGVIDVRETETMKMANHRIIIPQGGDIKLTRALIDDLTGTSPLKTPVMGLSATTLVSLSQALRKSEFTAIFYGSGIMNSGNAKENLSALNELVQTLQELGKKAFLMPMWHEPNGMGVIKSLNEFADIPSALDFTSGKAVPLEIESTLQKIAKKEYDAALIVGSDALALLPGRASKGLANTRTIYIGSAGGLTDHEANLSLRVTDDILYGSGTITRIDMKDIKLKTWGANKQSLQNVFDVISQLHQLIQAKLKD